MFVKYRGGEVQNNRRISEGTKVQIRTLPDIYFGHEPSPSPWCSYVLIEAGHVNLVHRPGMRI